MFAFGMIQPAGTSIVLDCERENAGAASTALGASGFLMGGIVSPLVGIGNIFIASGTAICWGGVNSRFHPLRLSALARGVPFGWNAPVIDSALPHLCSRAERL